MKSLADIKDKQGVSLKAFMDILVQKCRDANVAVVIFISELDPTAPATYMASNLHRSDIPNATRQFANIIEGQPSDERRIDLTDAEPS